jgi:hypothetical protein
MLYLLPFRTFHDAAEYDIEVQVVCRSSLSRMRTGTHYLIRRFALVLTLIGEQAPSR